MGANVSHNDKVMLLGSCFADEIGRKMLSNGFDAMINPFGPLYNPASIAASVARLDSGQAFTDEDCVEMGAGAGKICSFSHYTKFARRTAEEFLQNANNALAEASVFWHSCNKVIITLGTASVWEHRDFGIVSNCLKRDNKEFRHYRLGVEQCTSLLEGIIGKHPDKEFIFTVSPIRHLSQGAHENTLSKATLHLAIEQAIARTAVTGPDSRPNASYFPAWEIMMDDLRDYSFYAEDKMHPNDTAVETIWKRFIDGGKE